jgi:hypothetical protein
MLPCFSDAIAITYFPLTCFPTLFGLPAFYCYVFPTAIPSFSMLFPHLKTLDSIAICLHYISIDPTHVCYPKIRSLQNTLSGRNDYPDNPHTPHHCANHDKSDRREFSGSRQFRHSSRSHSPHHPLSSKSFPRCKPLPHLITSPVFPLICHPNNNFFSLVQTPEAPWSVLYIWGKMPVRSASVVQKTFGMAQRSGVERTTREDSFILTGNILCHN